MPSSMDPSIYYRFSLYNSLECAPISQEILSPKLETSGKELAIINLNFLKRALKNILLDENPGIGQVNVSEHL